MYSKIGGLRGGILISFFKSLLSFLFFLPNHVNVVTTAIAAASLLSSVIMAQLLTVVPLQNSSSCVTSRE